MARVLWLVYDLRCGVVAVRTRSHGYFTKHDQEKRWRTAVHLLQDTACILDQPRVYESSHLRSLFSTRV